MTRLVAVILRHVLLGTGEVYLDCILHDLRRRHPRPQGLKHADPADRIPVL